MKDSSVKWSLNFEQTQEISFLYENEPGSAYPVTISIEEWQGTSCIAILTDYMGKKATNFFRL